MCLVAFSWKSHPDYPLVIRANRDEFFERPTQKIHFWESGFYGGKDLKSEGTWMGYQPNGRWSLLTNYRDFNHPKKASISRGKLVQNFLESTTSPLNYLEEVRSNQKKYDGFNLLVSDGKQLVYYSNYGEDIIEIEPGIHGLSNGLLNDPWPKVELAKRQLNDQLESPISTQSLLNILNSHETFPIEDLPNTGVPPKMEAGLSSQFIRLNDNYGTVSATALVVEKSGKVTFQERSFEWDYLNFTDETCRFTSQT